MEFITQQMVTLKLMRMLAQVRLNGASVGLHGNPRCGLNGFCGIGPVAMYEDGISFGDIYVGLDGRYYQRINAMVEVACRQLNIPFRNCS